MPKAQRIQKWVNEELDVLMSTVDAEKTLEQLEVDRETICKMMQRCEVNKKLCFISMFFITIIFCVRSN